jgi:hypothetical protein
MKKVMDKKVTEITIFSTFIPKCNFFQPKITFLAIFHTHIEYFVMFKSEPFAHFEAKSGQSHHAPT